ncbi:MAG TPA: hypothetical protein VHE78_04545 [Gemmatimonadaceae bacterium]|nr:hypothetical protein [Gemmatimonadaceae bacterium]
MTVALRLVLLAAAMAVGTAAFGWVAVPVIAAAWGLIARLQRGTALAAGLAGMLAWAALLALDAARGPLEPLAQSLGSLFSVKTIAVYAVTLALPGLLAVTAALLARSVATQRS